MCAFFGFYQFLPKFLSAPVAQLDRVGGFEPLGREFESLRVRHFPSVMLLTSSAVLSLSFRNTSLVPLSLLLIFFFQFVFDAGCEWISHFVSGYLIGGLTLSLPLAVCGFWPHAC